MKLETLKERLKNVEENLLQTRANYNALEGARQELVYWIDALEKEAKADS